MSLPKALEQRVRGRLRALEETHLLRTLRSPSGMDFSSNDYLGLAGHPVLQECMAAAVREEGCGSTGSRLLRGQRNCFAAVERRFAQFKRTERALYFSSGYLANLAVLTTLPERGDIVLSDALNHASLIDGVRLSAAGCVVFPHADVAAVANLLDRHRGPRQIFVVTESLFSMDGDEAPLQAYAELCRKTGACLIVDEAHAVGVYGGRGSGLIEETRIGDDLCVSINTAGKALGVCGAFVAGPEWVVEYLIQRARPFAFSTAAPPAVAPTLEASLAIVEGEPERRARLLGRARDLRARLTALGVTIAPGRSQIIPVVIGDNQMAVTIAGNLQSQGFDVRAIRPPSVAPWYRPTPPFRQHRAHRRGDRTVRHGSGRVDVLSAVLRGVFVTGTDTGVGKTVVAAAIFLRYRQLMPRYWKPVQTGIEQDDDSATVRQLTKCRDADVLDRGVRLLRPVSPHLAARLSGETIVVSELLAIASGEPEAPWIIEGAGGVLVPLNGCETMATLMIALAVPVVVAARTTLGTINHTLLTLEALRSRGLRVAGVVMVGAPDGENRAAIEHCGQVPMLGTLPLLEPLEPDVLESWASRELDRDGFLRRYLA